MSKTNKIKDTKQTIYSLAQAATNKIYENKLLSQEIISLKGNINLIKEILMKYSSLTPNDESKKKKLILDGVYNIHDSLKKSNEKLNKEKLKLNRKLENELDKIFDKKEILRQELSIKKIDNFILLSKLEEKDTEITNISHLINSFIIAKMFPIEKLDKKIGPGTGCYYFDNVKQKFSDELMNELLYVNYYIKNCARLNEKKKYLQNKINYYNEVISYIKKLNLIGKSFNEDIKNNQKEELLINIKAKLSGSQRNKNKSKKIDILTVSQLFDVNNDEGKSEAIIDDELHSDDDVTFQPKVKQNNKISKGFRLTQIQKKIPKVDLSMIEFNKKKIMNEADLYSFKRRKFESKNIDEQIKEMSIKRKEILHKCKISVKKIIAMKQFSENMQKNYNILKPLKLKTSVFVGINDNNINFDDNKEELKDIEEINECESDEENYDNIMNENINYTQRDIKKKFKIQKSSVKNLDRKIMNDETNNKIYKIKKNQKDDKKKIKRAKSK